MSKLFINTVVQLGGNLSRNEVITILNAISKHINKKFKILEYTYAIKMKIEPLPLNNWIGLPKNVAITTMAKVNGSVHGTIPIPTTIPVSVPVPTITPITTGVPLSPFGPVLGVPGFAVNPFGANSTIQDKIEKAKKYLEIYQSINSQLIDWAEGKIEKKSVDTRYFEFVDIDEPEPIDDLLDEISGYSGYSARSEYSGL